VLPAASCCRSGRASAWRHVYCCLEVPMADLLAHHRLVTFPAAQEEPGLAPCVRCALWTRVLELRYPRLGLALAAALRLPARPGQQVLTRHRLESASERATLDDVVAHPVANALAARGTGRRRSEPEFIHLPRPLLVVIAASPGLALFLLPQVRHLVHQRRSHVARWTALEIGRVQADLVGRFLVVFPPQRCEEAKAVGRAREVQNHRPQDAAEQSDVEVVPHRAVGRELGIRGVHRARLHVCGVFVVHKHHSVKRECGSYEPERSAKRMREVIEACPARSTGRAAVALQG
jgi:hypothetical protein